MHILIADDDPKLSAALGRVLASAGHEVKTARGGQAALDKLSDQPPDILILDWLLSGVDGMALVKHAHQHLASRPAVVMLSTLTQHEAKVFAMNHGVDAFIPKPARPAELVETVRHVSGLRANAPQIDQQSAGRHLEHSPFWKSFGQHAAEHLRACTGIYQLERTLEKPNSDDGAVRATMGMVDARQRLEMNVALACSRESGAILAQTMLGETSPSDEALRETLEELCNNLLGFAKARLRPDGYAFTLTVSQQGSPAVDSPYVAGMRTVIEGGGARIVLEAGIRGSASRSVKLTELQENMILLEDLRNDAGALLLPEGTRITSLTAKRMAQQDHRRQVRVALVGG